MVSRPFPHGGRGWRPVAAEGDEGDVTREMRGQKAVCDVRGHRVGYRSQRISVKIFSLNPEQPFFKLFDEASLAQRVRGPDRQASASGNDAPRVDLRAVAGLRQGHGISMAVGSLGAFFVWCVNMLSIPSGAK